MQMEEGMTSSLHGPNELGYTRATMEMTKGSNYVNMSQSYKNFRIYGLFSATREYEDGIASNRRSASYGEYVPEFCTHRPSRLGS